MTSDTQSMANRAQGIHERINEGATRAVREDAPEWVISLLIDEAERLETLAMDVAKIHNADEMMRPRTVWDPPKNCPHMERCAQKGRELAVAVEAFEAGECPRSRIVELAAAVLR